VTAYAAYLRIYEPVSAFHEPDRSRWAAYAASSTRPRRRDSLAVEHAEALRRAITTPWVTVPERESEHAYVRRVEGTTYVCPWQTRLRCLLAYGQMRSGSGAVLACEGPTGEGLAGEGLAGEGLADEGSAGDRSAGEKLTADGDPALAALARLGEAGPARPHIVASSWTVPLTWFVPFAPAERWLSLGAGRGRDGAAATASATRALVYTTPMTRARRRVARGLGALRHLPAGSGDAVLEPSRAVGELAEVGRWLEDFHPYSLVELDYGGLVHLVSDDALRGDQSVAEIRAGLEGAARGECKLAVAMYMRARDRWRAYAEFEQAN
jgi:hypothetical protein